MSLFNPKDSKNIKDQPENIKPVNFKDITKKAESVKPIEPSVIITKDQKEKEPVKMKTVESAELQKANEKTQLAERNAMPAYLSKYKEDKPIGLQDLQKYFVPPRLKVVQAQSGEQYKKDFQIGDVLLLPQKSLIAHSGEAFWVTPIFQFTEFCAWNPYGMKGQLPAVRERTVNMESDIAKRARSKKESDWYQTCPEAPKAKQGDPQYQIRNCEHINFICVLRFNKNKPNHPANAFANNPFLISFHHSGFWEGKALSTLILNRHQHIFSCQYELSTTDKTNAKGSWKGFNINNPTIESEMAAFVEAEEDYLNYKALYDTLQQKFMDDEIRADYEDDLESEPVADSAGKF